MTQGVLWQDGKFSATRIGLRVKGQPKLGEWSSALKAALGTKDGLQWAVGDLLLYADSRDWEDGPVEEILDATGLKRATLNNHKSVAKAWPLERRTPQPWSYHSLLCGLDPEEADALLAEAVEKKWRYEELHAHVRAKRQKNQKAALQFPAGTFGLMLADPVWKRSIADKDCFDPAKLQSMAGEVQKVAAPTCVLYLVTPAPLVKAGVTTLEAWGFELKATHALVGQSTLRETAWCLEQHEIVLVGARGPSASPIEQHVPPSVFYTSNLERTNMMDRLEQAYPDATKVRLFSTEARSGWATLGDVLAPKPEPERGIVVREAVPA